MFPLRTTLPAAALAGALLLSACGGADRHAPDPPVRLTLEAPGDAAVVRGREVEVRGRVGPPESSVLVAGRAVEVAGGGFRASVPLREGTNVIDVLASADGRAPAMTALRVTREVTVRVPDVAGLAPRDAEDRLAAAGLRSRVIDESDLLDALLVPLDRRVCETRPGAGDAARRGATVTLKVAKVC